jgi:Transglutaminase-like superfamily
MFLLIVRAYIALIRFDLFLSRGDFAGLYDAVRRRTRRTVGIEDDITRKICSAVDIACIWYWKHVLCLQRSAAAACLLRDNGVPAELVIGAQHMPFRAHAWVEVQGCVVNDKSYTNEMYAVLDRC